MPISYTTRQTSWGTKFYLNICHHGGLLRVHGVVLGKIILVYSIIMIMENENTGSTKRNSP